MEEKLYITNSETGRRKLDDYKVTVYPSEHFQREQYRVNVHHKNIRDHRVTTEGKPVIRPMRDQYPSTGDYSQFRQDCETYEQASLLKN
jgi:hypothetical protein